MLIQKDQTAGMLAGNETLLRQAIQKQVREEHAYVVQDLPQDLFNEMVDRGMRYARGYGLDQPSDLACFVLLMFEFGPEFWRHPAIGDVLQDTSLPPSKRLRKVVDGTPDQVWRYLVGHAQAALVPGSLCTGRNGLTHGRHAKGSPGPGSARGAAQGFAAGGTRS